METESKQENNAKSLIDNALIKLGIVDMGPAFKKAIEKEGPGLMWGIKMGLISSRIVLEGTAIDDCLPSEIKLLSSPVGRIGRGFMGTSKERIREDGFIGEIFKTLAFQKLLGKHQLGFSRHSPENNYNTRGSHSIRVTMAMLNAIKSSAYHSESSSENLMKSLENDLYSEGIVSRDIVLSPAQVVDISTQLITLLGMYHDIMMPSGGVGIQIEKNIDEEKLLSDALLNRVKRIRGEQEGLVIDPLNAVDDIERFLMGIEGINVEKALEFMAKAVTGKSNSFIANLLKAKSKDTLDLDRAAYTEEDNVENGLLVRDYPEVFMRILRKVVGLYNLATFNGQQYIVDGLRDLERDVFNERLHWTMILRSIGYESDLIPSTRVNQEGEIVFTNYAQALALIAIRATAIPLHYLSPRMIGLEVFVVEELKKTEEGTNLLADVSGLIAMNDQEFYDRANLGYLNISDSPIPRYNFIGELSDHKVEGKINIRLKIKPGMDTLMDYNGRTYSLRQILEREEFRSNPLVNWISYIMKKYDGKYWNISMYDPLARTNSDSNLVLISV